MDINKMDLSQQVLEALEETGLTGDEIMNETGIEWTLLSKVLNELEKENKVVKTESGLLNDPWVWELTHSESLSLPKKEKKESKEDDNPAQEINTASPEINLIPFEPIELRKEVEISTSNIHQREGYKLAQEPFIEGLAQINLSAYESRILWAIFKKTNGWKKKEKISITEFQKITGLDRRNVVRTLSHLIKRKIIIRIDNTFIKTYGFQENYLNWEKIGAIQTPSK